MYEQNSTVSVDPFGVPFEDFPQNLAIFPLPGAMLLPHGRMPLNIFEPRYLKMVMDSLKQSRLIGMVQPLEQLSDPIPEKTALFHHPENASRMVGGWLSELSSTVSSGGPLIIQVSYPS